MPKAMYFLLATALLSLLSTLPARADLRACNHTGAQISVAIGYGTDGIWTSEGWWTMASGDCSTMISGNLKHRYYYWRATQDGAALPAENYEFCTSHKVFTIVGDSDCKARGYEAAAFSQVDTGPTATDYTINIAIPETGQTNTAPSDGYAEIRATLQGLWLDSGDEAFGMFVQGNRIQDRYQGLAAAAASWRIADTCPGANGAGPVMLVTYDDSDGNTLCWVLKGLNESELLFRAIGGSADVYMKKVR